MIIYTRIHFNANHSEYPCHVLEMNDEQWREFLFEPHSFRKLIVAKILGLDVLTIKEVFFVPISSEHEKEEIDQASATTDRKVAIRMRYRMPVTPSFNIVDMDDETWFKFIALKEDEKIDYVLKLLHKEHLELKVKEIFFAPLN